MIPTLREAPSDAEITSHKLLRRAGLIRKLAAGVYTFLPLGLRVLRKVENIIREEMDRAGAVEVLMPALQPPEIWEASGRAQTASDVMTSSAVGLKNHWRPELSLSLNNTSPAVWARPLASQISGG